MGYLAGKEKNKKDKNYFNLKQNYQPGNLGNYNMSTISDELLNKELNNGRLAMIAFMAPAPNRAVISMAITSEGKAKIRSLVRMITSSRSDP